MQRGKTATFTNLHPNLMPWRLSAVRLHEFPAYSLASPIPPGVIANVASFSGISGLGGVGGGGRKQQVLNVVTEPSPKGFK